MRQRVTGRVWLLVWLTLAMLPAARAQQMRVESFVQLSQAEDPDAKDPTFRRADTQASRSGQYCAIIKLVSTVQDKAFTFDLGTDYVPEGAVEYKDNGEVWIYVPAGTNKIKISHPRFGQLDTRDGYYHFNTAGIRRCVGATVYRLRLHTDFNPDEDIIKDADKLATVRFNVPTGAATVHLRKIPEATDASGVLEKQMPLGIYHYRVSAPDYYDHDGVFELTREGATQTVEVRLRQAFGWLSLSPDFNAIGCTFTVDSTRVDATALRSMKLRSGQHTIRVQHPHYYPFTTEVQIRDSVSVDFLPTLQPRLGLLDITVNVPGSVLKVDGVEIGRSPLEAPHELIIGQHTVEVSCSNYKTETYTVEVKEGETTSLPVTLADVAHFTFTSRPSGATLYIDGERKGVTPCDFTFASGDYTIRLTRHKYKDWEKQVHLNSAQPSVSFKMARQYQQRHMIYAQPTLQVGSMTGVGGELGGYLYNVHVSVSYLAGIGKSDVLYWNNASASVQRPVAETFKESWLGLKLGYGIILGTRFRLTPQVGATLQTIEGSQGSRCSATIFSLGVRAECAVANHIGVSVAPEYGISYDTSPLHLELSRALPQFDEWNRGFNLRMGVHVYF